MIRQAIVILGLSVMVPVSANECRFLKAQVELNKSVSIARLNTYRSAMAKCNVTYIDHIPIQDYFNLEQDALLAFAYMSINKKETHPILLAYYIKKKRWDFLLTTLNELRKYKKKEQMAAINYLYYKKLPAYIDIEIKEVFNFLSEPEKVQLSQDLIPNDPIQLKYINKKKNYVYEYWPVFDQFAFIIHLREQYPIQFEKLAVYWRELLVSFYYQGAEKKDPTFELMGRLIKKEVLKEIPDGVNPSFQAFYLIKTNQFSQAEQWIQSQQKDIYFNQLRYFKFFNKEQQTFLMKKIIPFSISDIQRLFNEYYLKMDPVFQNWVWAIAIENKFVLDDELANPMIFLTMRYQLGDHQGAKDLIKKIIQDQNTHISQDVIQLLFQGTIDDCEGYQTLLDKQLYNNYFFQNNWRIIAKTVAGWDIKEACNIVGNIHNPTDQLLALCTIHANGSITSY